MKTNKVKGFTLVELIVVIAIIGVLAAILVPSMLGYVKKSKVAAANSNAKSLYNAAATALTDMDAQGLAVTEGKNEYTTSSTDTTTMQGLVHKYFNSVDTFIGTGKAAAWTVSDDKSAVTAAAVCDGKYVGTNPKATVDTAATTADYANAAAALTYAAS